MASSSLGTSRSINPPTGANDGLNDGLEAITWVPDSDLMSSGFIDERTHQIDAPALDPDHGSSLFFFGLEEKRQERAAPAVGVLR
jgi:hypothetical protein